MPSTTAFDQARYKADARAEWGQAASGWRDWTEVLEAPDAGAAVSAKLVELAGIGPGAVVLDVAAGYGEPGLTAARAAGPGGRVVCADLSAAMLAVGRERAATAGLGNLEFVEADAEALDLPEASFDAVLSRQGLQFLPDVAGALARRRALLRPRGAAGRGRVGVAASGPVRRPRASAPGRAGAAAATRRRPRLLRPGRPGPPGRPDRGGRLLGRAPGR
jgi:SAM-dependent methyltransferase